MNDATKFTSPEGNNNVVRVDFYNDADKSKSTLRIEATCSGTAGINNIVLDDTQSPPLITFNSKTACPIGSLSALWGAIENNKWALFTVFLIVGLFVCFLGRTLFKVILFIAGMLVGFGLVWLISYSTFLKNNDKTWVFWTVIAVSSVLGIIIGILMVKLTKVGAFLIAAWGGYSLGLLLYPTFLYKIWSGTAAVWVFSISFALVSGILACFLFETVLILSTSLAGSFLAI
jgi:hypothetical protein